MQIKFTLVASIDPAGVDAGIDSAMLLEVCNQLKDHAERYLVAAGISPRAIEARANVIMEAETTFYKHPPSPVPAAKA